MTIRDVKWAAVLAVLVAASALAQSPGEPAMPPVPDGADAWVVQVYSTGGFAGRGDGRNLIVSSDGRISSPASRRDAQAAPAVLTSLREAIRALTPDHWREITSTTCRDCYTYVVVLARREADGLVRTYRTSWDETTKPRVGAEIRRIYELAASLNPR